ncbi:MAG: hypothetical protein OXD44_11385 [Gammaproteobacteria bacterium]|nr:hypothetical protein [Gammaproteobacteria bacterium]MCY4314270.1 hypothetical protein [Gammaproteobacteria bacterium]
MKYSLKIITLLVVGICLPAMAQASSNGETGSSACTRLSQYLHYLMYVSDGPKSDSVSIQIRPASFYIVRSTQYQHDFDPDGTIEEKKAFFNTNEYSVDFVLLEDGEYSNSIKKLMVGQVSRSPKRDLEFRIERITNLEPDTPYTAVLYVGKPSQPVSRLCFRTAADPNDNS